MPGQNGNVSIFVTRILAVALLTALTLFAADAISSPAAEKGPHTMQVATTKAPLIDSEVPKHLETATFALG
jgi:hypothetical protein